MIVVQSVFNLASDSKRDAIKLMRNMVRLCRLEHGCISYEYFEGVSNENQVVLIQEWEDAECLQEHYQTAHMEHFLSKLGDFLVSPVESRSYVSPNEASVTSVSAEDLPKPEQTIH
ncbi:MAG: hypothetical protein CMQ45_01985 [Gammaproteobacteria bacterium]|nr:hypothetical protein [Gammaproteobacteria bacterium]|tara:strand:- start:501 stop:848 length:348 start_codon:yes stop_codon:yes gene_type:complete